MVKRTIKIKVLSFMIVILVVWLLIETIINVRQQNKIEQLEDEISSLYRIYQSTYDCAVPPEGAIIEVYQDELFCLPEK